jgi:hypothetical protein
LVRHFLRLLKLYCQMGGWLKMMWEGCGMTYCWYYSGICLD